MPEPASDPPDGPGPSTARSSTKDLSSGDGRLRPFRRARRGGIAVCLVTRPVGPRSWGLPFSERLGVTGPLVDPARARSFEAMPPPELPRREPAASSYHQAASARGHHGESCAAAGTGHGAHFNTSNWMVVASNEERLKDTGCWWAIAFASCRNRGPGRRTGHEGRWRSRGDIRWTSVCRGARPFRRAAK